MIKKITLIFIISILICSCGKKADPEYNAKNKLSSIVLI